MQITGLTVFSKGEGPINLDMSKVEVIKVGDNLFLMKSKQERIAEILEEQGIDPESCPLEALPELINLYDAGLRALKVSIKDKFSEIAGRK